MTNIITKNGVVIHATDDEILLPTSSEMIEMTPLQESDIIKIGGGDVNEDNCFLYTDITVPEDYENLKYLYDGTFILNPDYVEE